MKTEQDIKVAKLNQELGLKISKIGLKIALLLIVGFAGLMLGWRLGGAGIALVSDFLSTRIEGTRALVIFILDWRTQIFVVAAIYIFTLTEKLKVFIEIYAYSKGNDKIGESESELLVKKLKSFIEPKSIFYAGYVLVILNIAVVALTALPTFGKLTAEDLIIAILASASAVCCGPIVLGMFDGEVLRKLLPKEMQEAYMRDRSNEMGVDFFPKLNGYRFRKRYEQGVLGLAAWPALLLAQRAHSCSAEHDLISRELARRF